LIASVDGDGVSTDMTGVPAESVRYVEAGDVERRTSRAPAHEEVDARAASGRDPGDEKT